MEVNRYNIVFSTDQATSSPLAPGGYPSTNVLSYIMDKPPLQLSSPGNYYVVECIHICLPFSFNAITVNNNTVINNNFSITPVMGPTIVYNFDIVFPVGNYDIDQFTAIFSQLLYNAYQSAEPGGDTQFLCQVSNLAQGQCSIAVILNTTDSSISLTLNFGYNPMSVGNNYIADIMGFKMPVILNAPSHVDSVVYSNAYFNVCPIAQIIMRSQALTGWNYEFLGPATATGYGACAVSTVIGCFSLFTAPQSYLNSSNIVPMKTRVRNTQINNIDITFFSDDSTIPLDFLGAVGDFTLSIVEYSPPIVPNDINIVLNKILTAIQSLEETTKKVSQAQQAQGQQQGQGQSMPSGQQGQLEHLQEALTELTGETANVPEEENLQPPYNELYESLTKLS